MTEQEANRLLFESMLEVMLRTQGESPRQKQDRRLRALHRGFARMDLDTTAAEPFSDYVSAWLAGESPSDVWGRG